jgi:acetylornithine/N-succinyldiaminopimelate aminotransferase
MKLFDVYPLFDINIVKGKGVWVWDDKGQKYLDLYGGHAVISIGHNHSHFVTKLDDQLDNLVFYSNSIINKLQVDLAKKLGAISGCPNYSLFLCNSGAEANENALKLASFHNRRKKIITFKKSFHGRTSLAVSVTDIPSIIAPINENEHVVFLDLNDMPALERELGRGDVCAVIVEGIQGIGGIYTPEADFLKNTQELCNKYNTVLVLDEVQSGYGRSGKFFAYQHAGIEPDIISMAKGMGNGFPIGGILIHPKFTAKHGMLGTTFGGNHLACAAGIAVLEVLMLEDMIQNAADVGNFLLEALKNFPQIKEVRGMGLMIGIEFENPAHEIRDKLLYEHKIFTGSASAKNVIRLLPPLCLSRAEAELFLEKFSQVIN